MYDFTPIIFCTVVQYRPHYSCSMNFPWMGTATLNLRDSLNCSTATILRHGQEQQMSLWATTSD